MPLHVWPAMPPVISVILLVLTCGAADRIIGWGEWGRSKPVAATILALFAIAAFSGLPLVSAATFPIAFMIWRTPGWRMLGGSINPEPEKALGTFLRHMMVVGFLAPAYWAGKSIPITLICLVTFALIATTLAVYNYYNKAHSNQFVETARGLALGGCLAYAFILA